MSKVFIPQFIHFYSALISTLWCLHIHWELEKRDLVHFLIRLVHNWHFHVSNTLMLLVKLNIVIMINFYLSISNKRCNIEIDFLIMFLITFYYEVKTVINRMNIKILVLKQKFYLNGRLRWKYNWRKRNSVATSSLIAWRAIELF